MKRIFLVRHGESLANIDKTVHFETADHMIPLSDRGHEQAEAAGEFLHNYLHDIKNGIIANSGNHPWGARLIQCRLWTSPYLRTRQTADDFEKGATDIILDRREHVNLCEQQFGLFDGLEDEDLKVKFPLEFAHYKKCEEHHGKFWAPMPLGESRYDVAIRVHQAFGTFHRDCDRHGVENIIVVCHGVTLRAFVMQWLHLTPEWFDEEPNPGNCWIRLIEDHEDRGYIYKG